MPHPCSKLTRREALALGAAAGVTATVAVPHGAFAAPAVGGTGASGPEYLRRSGYAERTGEWFTVGGKVLTLVAVEDVAGAQDDESLRGHESAFSLRFAGVADALPSALHEVHHDLLGPFPLFLGPTGAVRGLEQEYNAVVDRTVRVRLTPTPDAGPSPLMTASQPASEPAKAKADAKGEDAPAADDPPPSEPTERDLEIVAERERVVHVARARRRRRVRRARHKLRRAHANRLRFVSRQRKAARNIRRRWLRRHGP